MWDLCMVQTCWYGRTFVLKRLGKTKRLRKTEVNCVQCEECNGFVVYVK